MLLVPCVLVPCGARGGPGCDARNLEMMLRLAGETGNHRDTAAQQMGHVPAAGRANNSAFRVGCMPRAAHDLRLKLQATARLLFE